MSEDRRRILEMLAQGKISAAETEDLLDALGGPTAGAEASSTEKQDPKYLRVVVEAGPDGDPKERVNVRVPFQLLRAGVKLAALIPGVVRDQVKVALAQSGVAVDLDKLKVEDLEELIQHLSALQVDVDNRHEKVRVFCE